jgi:AcrR family transcriptional regulator
MPRRSDQTRQKVQQAFQKLLSKKTYEEITMEEIARQAGHSRATVYRYYMDKEALLLDCFEMVAEELKDNVIYPKETSHGITPVVAYENLVMFYTHATAHRTLYQALFTSSASSNIRTYARRVIAGIIINTIEQEGTLYQLPAPTDIVCNLLGELVVGALVWLLEAKSNHDPALLAEIVMRMSETGVFGLTQQTAVASDISYRPFDPNKRPI